ncbi:peptidylprolyl isomerase [Porphyromonadaceae bacterium]
MRYKLFSVIAIVLFSSISGLMAQNSVIDEVIWVVGDEAILKSQVEEYRLSLTNQDKIDGDPYCVIPEQLAIQKLFLNQAKLDSIFPAEEDVLNRVEQQMNFLISQIGSKEKVEEYFNKSFTALREYYVEQIREQDIANQVQNKITGKIKITPSDVRKYYNSLPKDSLPYIPEQVEVQMILFEPKVPIEETDRIRNRLREFTDQVNSGERDFGTLATLYSQDVQTGRRGGELGFMGKNHLVPEFANVAFNLSDPTKVSRIVETEYGFHIIQLIERRGDRVNCRHILLKPEITQEARDMALSRLDTLITELKDNKFTFEAAANILSQDKDTRNNYGLMQNSQTGDSRFEMQQLPQEIAKAVATLQPGEISKPFMMVQQKNGKEVAVVVKLKNRISGHKANIGDDFQAIKLIVEVKKKEEALSSWIAKKQKETFIRINEGWRNCDFQYPGWVKE